MGLFRLLLRAFFRSSRPKLVKIRRETTVLEDGSPWRRRVAVGQSADIRIVEVTELRGRAWVIDGDTLDIGGMRIRLAGIGHIVFLWGCAPRSATCRSQAPGPEVVRSAIVGMVPLVHAHVCRRRPRLLAAG